MSVATIYIGVSLIIATLVTTWFVWVCQYRSENAWLKKLHRAGHATKAVFPDREVYAASDEDGREVLAAVELTKEYDLCVTAMIAFVLVFVGWPVMVFQVVTNTPRQSTR